MAKNIMYSKKKALLLTPGPVSSPSSILKALSQPMIHHRSLSFVNTLKNTQALLKKIFQTKQEVLILNASGTGAMSAALLNTLSPGDAVLVLSAGKFGERWKEIATCYKLKVFELKAPWGQSIDLLKAQEILNKYPQIKAILAQACETSTGVLHPVKELATITKKYKNTLFILDAISALGAVNIPMDKWGIDIMIGGSQKSFCLPAGMSFISLSKKAWAFNTKSLLPAYYFDLKKELKTQTKGQTAFSSNVSFIRALYAFLKPLEKTNHLEKMIQKSEQLLKITLKFCKENDLTIFASSPSLTSILLPKHIDGVKLKQSIEDKYHIIFGGGQGKLKGRIIRVSHLGNTSTSELKKALNYLILEIKSMQKKKKEKHFRNKIYAKKN